MKNYDKVKEMTIDEMAACFGSTEDCNTCVATNLCEYGVTCKDTIKKWLNSEAE